MPADIYPRTIPRDRAVAAMDLAHALLDHDTGLEPFDQEGDVELTAETYAEWRRLARIAVMDVRCRKCGCTEDDCRGCIERTGEACQWVEDDLCSACVGPPPPEPKMSGKKSAK